MPDKADNELGAGSAEKYTHKKYPGWKYHWTKDALIVKNAEEEAALGGGWADTPAAFEPYKGARPAGRISKPSQGGWISGWYRPRLPVAARIKGVS
jgi:hypothetical protein